MSGMSGSQAERQITAQVVSNKNEIALMVLSGIGNAFQYLFLFSLCGAALVYTSDLVAQDKLSSDVFSIIAGGIVTGSFALMNPRGRQDKTPQPLGWNGTERRSRRDEEE